MSLPDIKLLLCRVSFSDTLPGVMLTKLDGFGKDSPDGDDAFTFWGWFAILIETPNNIAPEEETVNNLFKDEFITKTSAGELELLTTDQKLEHKHAIDEVDANEFPSTCVFGSAATGRDTAEPGVSAEYGRDGKSPTLVSASWFGTSAPPL